MRKLYCLLLAPLFLLLVAGCDKDDEGMPLLKEEFVLDADASTLEFRVPFDDWWINKVENPDGGIYGMQENGEWVFIYLKGVGKRNATTWFSMEHTPDHTLRIEVKQNDEGEKRALVLHITEVSSGEEHLYTFVQPAL